MKDRPLVVYLIKAMCTLDCIEEAEHKSFFQKKMGV